MKKLFVTILAMFVMGVFFVQANDGIVKEAEAVVSIENEGKTEVKAEELPDAVKTALGGESFAGWEFVSAHKVKVGETKHYEIQLKKGEESTTVKFDKEGTLIQ